MLFKKLVNRIKFKILPTSLLFKNRLFVERDSKRKTIYGFINQLFKNSVWITYKPPIFHPHIKLQFSAPRFKVLFTFTIFIFWFYKRYFNFTDIFAISGLVGWLFMEFNDYLITFLTWLFAFCVRFIISSIYSYLMKKLTWLAYLKNDKSVEDFSLNLKNVKNSQFDFILKNYPYPSIWNNDTLFYKLVKYTYFFNNNTTTTNKNTSLFTPKTELLFLTASFFIANFLDMIYKGATNKKLEKGNARLLGWSLAVFLYILFFGDNSPEPLKGLWKPMVCECGGNLSILHYEQIQEIRRMQLKSCHMSSGSCPDEAFFNQFLYLKMNERFHPEKYAHEAIDLRYDSLKWGTISFLGGTSIFWTNPIFKKTAYWHWAQRASIHAAWTSANFAFGDYAVDKLNEHRAIEHGMVDRVYRINKF